MSGSDAAEELPGRVLLAGCRKTSLWRRCASTDGSVPAPSARAVGLISCGSILVPSDETVFCLFDGSEADVRAVSQQADMPFERVLASVRIDVTEVRGGMKMRRMLISLLALAGVAAALGAAGASGRSAPTCFGKKATITGSGTIIGTDANDVIVGSDGADTINGKGGDDRICGLGGDDQIQVGSMTTRSTPATAATSSGATSSTSQATPLAEETTSSTAASATTASQATAAPPMATRPGVATTSFWGTGQRPSHG